MGPTLFANGVTCLSGIFNRLFYVRSAATCKRIFTFRRLYILFVHTGMSLHRIFVFLPPNIDVFSMFSFNLYPTWNLEFNLKYWPYPRIFRQLNSKIYICQIRILIKKLPLIYHPLKYIKIFTPLFYNSSGPFFLRDQLCSGMKIVYIFNDELFLIKILYLKF